MKGSIFHEVSELYITLKVHIDINPNSDLGSRHDYPPIYR